MKVIYMRVSPLKYVDGGIDANAWFFMCHMLEDELQKAVGVSLGGVEVYENDIHCDTLLIYLDDDCEDVIDELMDICRTFPLLRQEKDSLILLEEEK